ncbi:putative methyltransferase NSUN7 [Polymixia lowei]
MEESLVSNPDYIHQPDPDAESSSESVNGPLTSSPPSSATMKPFSSLHPPLLHPSPLPPAVAPIPDQVFLQAAAIFQRLRVDEPITQQLLHYGKKVDTPLPQSRDKITQRQAYQLAFSTLKYQDLLENIITDSCFHTSQQISNDLLPLAMVMLFDLQDRKFLINKRSAKEGEELLQEVRNLESCLHRCKTKLAASLARYRVKQNLQSVSCFLSDPVRTKHHRARVLPLYAWVNTLRNSVEEVCEALRCDGVCELESGTEPEGSGFYRDPFCPDTLVLSHQLHALIEHSKLTTAHVLNIQDRSVSVAASALSALLSDSSDIMVVGSFSGLTVGHIAVLASACSGRVLVCGGDHTPLEREEIQEVITRMEIKNVRVLTEGFCHLDEWDTVVQRLKVVLVLPRCSSSALGDPVHTILSEHGDCDLLQDLSQGSVSQSRMHMLSAQQARLLTHALTFPKVQTVLYCTRSVYPEENEQLVKRVLQKAETHPKLLPFRVSATDKFFRIEPSEHTNGCFIARLAREADPAKVETVQDVLARAAAKGLLGGILEDRSKPGKNGKHRKSRAHATVEASAAGQEGPAPTETDRVAGQDPGSGGVLPLVPGTPTTTSRQPVSRAGTPADKHPSRFRPPPLQTGREHAQGQKPEPQRAGKPYKEVAKPGSPYMATRNVIRPNKELAMQEVLKPVDFVLPPISSPSLSSLSSRSSTPLSLPSVPDSSSAARLTPTRSSSSVTVSGLDKAKGSTQNPRPKF